MYCVVRQYTLSASANADDLVGKVREQFLPLVKAADGFISYTLAQTDDGQLITVGFFKNRKGADQSADLARAWVEKNVSNSVTGPPRISAGEIIFSERTGGEAGFGLLRRVKVKPGKRDAAVDVMRSKLLPMLKSTPGFVSTAVFEPSPNELLSVGAFRDRASAQNATNQARPMMMEQAGDLMEGPPEMTDAEIKLRHVNEAALV